MCAWAREVGGGAGEDLPGDYERRGGHDGLIEESGWLGRPNGGEDSERQEMSVACAPATGFTYFRQELFVGHGIIVRDVQE